MFLSAPLPIPQKFISRPKVVGAPSTSKCHIINPPAPKVWVRLNQVVAANVERLVITVGRHYSSASAEAGFLVRRMSDGLVTYNVSITAQPNTHDSATYEIIRPVEGWDDLGFYNNTGGAGTMMLIAIYEIPNLY